MTPDMEAFALMREELRHVRSINADLLAALKALMADIDSGLLVRNVVRDGEPKWALSLFDFVLRLQRAQAAIARAEGETV